MTAKALFNFSFILILAGMAAFAAGLIWRHYRRQQEVLKGHTTASVVRLELRMAGEKAHGPYQNRYHPVLQYYAQGQLYEKVLSEGAYPSKWEKGQKIPIEYDLQDPDKYRIHVRQKGDTWPILLYYGGIVLLAAGILLFIRYALRLS